MITIFSSLTSCFLKAFILLDTHTGDLGLQLQSSQHQLIHWVFFQLDSLVLKMSKKYVTAAQTDVLKLVEKHQILKSERQMYFYQNTHTHAHTSTVVHTVFFSAYLILFPLSNLLHPTLNLTQRLSHSCQIPSAWLKGWLYLGGNQFTPLDDSAMKDGFVCATVRVCVSVYLCFVCMRCRKNWRLRKTCTACEKDMEKDFNVNVFTDMQDTVCVWM